MLCRCSGFIIFDLPSLSFHGAASILGSHGCYCFDLISFCASYAFGCSPLLDLHAVKTPKSPHCTEEDDEEEVLQNATNRAKLPFLSTYATLFGGGWWEAARLRSR